MRKFLAGLTGLALASIMVVPAFAQDAPAPGTIADIVVAASSAATPEFSTLLTAVTAADPSVLAALSNPDASLTVFAPTDAAFAALADALGADAFNAVLADPAALTDILLFHVVDGAVMSGDVVSMLDAQASMGMMDDPMMNATPEMMEDGTMMVDAATISVPTLEGQYLDIARDTAGVITINGAVLDLSMVDIVASNGVIHVIDAVMIPESRTIADIVVASTGLETPEFTTLLAAVSAADPAVLELLSNPDATLTVFAPTDAAFAVLGDDTLNAVLADQAMLTGILQYHVLTSVVHSGDVAALLADNNGTFEVETANGASVTVTANEDGTISIGAATLLVTDIDASNGVIHVIDAVLLPPAA